MDLEAYSPVPITCGAEKYAESAEILLWGYAVGERPAQVWDLTSRVDMPPELASALQQVRDGTARTVWHNGFMFDTVVLRKVLQLEILPEAVIDTMVMAYQHGLPGALGTLTHDVFRFPSEKAKDDRGRYLCQLFCKPRPKNSKLPRATRKTHPAEWVEFVEYCRQDIVSMRELYRVMPRFNCTEQEHRWQLEDARINRRGMAIDLELAHAAQDASETEAAFLRQESHRLTDGQVDSVTKRQQLLDYLNATYGLDLKGLTKSEVEKRLEDDSLPEPVKEILKVRLMGSRTSVKKYVKLLECVCQDGRLRGTLQFRGAARTGRWSGRLFQPQNLARPTMSNEAIELAIGDLKAHIAHLLYADIGEVLSNCLRGEIVAPAGKKLVVADYSNVEGRVIAWLAGESWKLKAFADFDAGHGHDLYKVAYGKTFGVNPEKVTKAQRQIGKPIELGLGFGGGAGAFARFAQAYAIDLPAMAEEVQRSIAPEFWYEAEERFVNFSHLPIAKQLGKKVFVACDAIKRRWRHDNPHIASFWWDLEKACTQVLSGMGPRTVGKIRIEKRGAYLVMRLPSGRFLVYPSPRLGEDDCTFTYMGVEQFTRKWTRIKTFGGKIAENLTQATACDLLASALVRLEGQGYLPVLTIHDEVIAEAPDTSDYTEKRMAAVMTELPPWATGLPLAAAGFEGYRYRKD